MAGCSAFSNCRDSMISTSANNSSNRRIFSCREAEMENLFWKTELFQCRVFFWKNRLTFSNIFATLSKCKYIYASQVCIGNSVFIYPDKRILLLINWKRPDTASLRHYLGLSGWSRQSVVKLIILLDIICWLSCRCFFVCRGLFPLRQTPGFSGIYTCL